MVPLLMVMCNMTDYREGRGSLEETGQGLVFHPLTLQLGSDLVKSRCHVIWGVIEAEIFVVCSYAKSERYAGSKRCAWTT